MLRQPPFGLLGIALGLGLLLASAAAAEVPRLLIEYPATGSIFAAGESVWFRGKALDAAGTPIPGASMLWRLEGSNLLGSGASIATTALRTGPNTIELLDADGTGLASATVRILVLDPASLPPPRVQVLAPADGAQVTTADSLSLSGDVIDFRGDPLPLAGCRWTLETGELLGQGSPLTVPAPAEGAHRITLSAADSRGVTGQAVVDVTVIAVPPGPPPPPPPTPGVAVTIDSPAEGAGPFYETIPLDVSGHAVSGPDGWLSGTALSWSDDVAGELGAGGWLRLETLTAGPHVLRLQASDSTGVTSSATRFIEVLPVSQIPPPSVSLTAPTSDAVLYATLPVTLQGSGTDLKDGPLDATLSWSSSIAGFLGTGSSLPLSSLSTGVDRLDLTASTARGARATASVTVEVRPASEMPSPAVWISLPQATAEYFETLLIPFEGTAQSLKDGFLGPPNIQWSLGGQGPIGDTLSFSTSALTSGVYTVELRATDSLGHTGLATVALTVRPLSELPAPTLVLVEPGGSSPHYEGLELQGSCIATDLKDGALDGASIVWSSEPTGLAAIGASFTTTALPAGSYELRCTATSSTGKSTTATTALLVRPAAEIPIPVVTISSPSPGSSWYATVPVPLAAGAVDFVQGSLSPESLEWRTETGLHLGTGASFTTTSLAEGAHFLTVTARASRGAVGTATVAVEVLSLSAAPAPSVAIVTPAPESRFRVGAPLTLQAQSTDTIDGDLSGGHLAWSIEPGVVTTAGNGLAYSFGFPGIFSVRVTATALRGVSASAAVTVTAFDPAQVNFPTVVVQQPAAGAVVRYGETVHLVGTAEDPEQGMLCCDSLTWATDAQGILGHGAALDARLTRPGPQQLLLWATNASGATRVRAVPIVVLPPVPTISIVQPSAGQSFYRHARVSLDAMAADDHDGALTGSRIQWRSSRDGAVASGDSTSTVSLTTGAHELVASVANSFGVAATAATSVVIEDSSGLPGPTVTLVSPEASRRYFASVSVRFACQGTDPVDGEMAGSALNWSSSMEGSLGIGTEFSRVLAEGLHQIRLETVNSRGQRAEQSLMIEVESAQAIPSPTVEILRPGAGDVIYETVPVAAEGNASDYLDGTLGAASLTWSSARSGVLGTGPLLTTTFTEPGGDVLTLTAVNSHGKSAFATRAIEVRPVSAAPPPVVTIQSPASGATVAAGQALHLLAQALDVIEGTLSPGRLFWSSTALSTPVTGNDRGAIFVGAPGERSLQVAAHTARGATGWATAIVVVVDAQSQAPPRVVLVDPLPPPQVRLGATVLARARAFSDREGWLSDGQMQWLDAAGGVLGTGETLTWQPNSVAASFLLRAVASDSLGRTGEASLPIQVLPPIPRVTIDFPSDGWSILPGDPLTLRAHAEDGLGVWLDGTAIHWTVDSGAVPGAGATLRTTNLAEGSHGIEARAVNSYGVEGSAAISVVVTIPAPVVVIDAPSPGERLDYYLPVALQGRAWIPVSEPRTVPSSHLAWVADGLTPLGAGASVTTTALTTGTHEISLSALGFDATVVTTSVSVVVARDANDACDSGNPADRRPLKIRVEFPSGCHQSTSVLEGSQIYLQAVATDVIEGELPDWATSWSSSLAGAIGAGRLLSTTGLAVGHHVLTVSAQAARGVTGVTTIALDVLPVSPPTVTLLAPAQAEASRYYTGQPLELRAEAYSYAETTTVGERLVWTVDGAAVGTGFSVAVPAPAVGARLLEARYTDSRQRTGSASMVLEVRDEAQFTPALLSVSRVPRSTASLDVLTSTSPVWPRTLRVWPETEDGMPGGASYASDAGAALSLGGTASRSVVLTITLAGAAQHVGTRLWKRIGVVGLTSLRPLAITSLAVTNPSTSSLAYTLPLTSEPMAVVLERDRSVGWQLVPGPAALQLELRDESGARRGEPVVLPLLPRESSTPVLTMIPATSTVYALAGQAPALSATAVDSVDGALPASSVQWSRYTSGTSWEPVCSGLDLTGLSATSYTLLRVSATNSGSTTVTSDVVVLGLSAPVVSIRAEPPVTWAFAGSQVQFHGEVDWGVLETVPATYSWGSDRQGSLGSSLTLTLTNWVSSVHELGLDVTGPAGLQGHATYAIEVVEPPSVTALTVVDSVGVEHALDIGSGGGGVIESTDQALRVYVSNPSGRSSTLRMTPRLTAPLAVGQIRVYAQGSPTPVATEPYSTDASGDALAALPAGVQAVVVELTLVQTQQAQGKAAWRPASGGGGSGASGSGVGGVGLGFGFGGGGANLPGVPGNGFAGVTGIPRPKGPEDDWDGDGLPNAWEALQGMNPFALDTDGDGRADRQEWVMGTDPKLADSDADLVTDGDDASPVQFDDPIRTKGPDQVLHWTLKGQFWPTCQPRPKTTGGPPGHYRNIQQDYLHWMTYLFEFQRGWCTAAAWCPSESGWYCTAATFTDAPWESGSIGDQPRVYQRETLGPVWIDLPGGYEWHCCSVRQPRRKAQWLGSPYQPSAEYWTSDSPGTAAILGISTASTSPVGVADGGMVDSNGAGLVLLLNNTRDWRNPVRLRLCGLERPVNEMLRNLGSAAVPAEYAGMKGLTATCPTTAILPVPCGTSRHYFPPIGAEGRVDFWLESKRHDGSWEEKGHRTVTFKKMPLNVVDIRRVTQSGDAVSVTTGAPNPAGIYYQDRAFQLVFDRFTFRDRTIVLQAGQGDTRALMAPGSAAATQAVSASYPTTLSIPWMAATSSVTVNLSDNWDEDFRAPMPDSQLFQVKEPRSTDGSLTNVGGPAPFVGNQPNLLWIARGNPQVGVAGDPNTYEDLIVRVLYHPKATSGDWSQITTQNRERIAATPLGQGTAFPFRIPAPHVVRFSPAPTITMVGAGVGEYLDISMSQGDYEVAAKAVPTIVAPSSANPNVDQVVAVSVLASAQAVPLTSVLGLNERKTTAAMTPDPSMVADPSPFIISADNFRRFPVGQVLFNLASVGRTGPRTVYVQITPAAADRLAKIGEYKDIKYGGGILWPRREPSEVPYGPLGVQAIQGHAESQLQTLLASSAIDVSFVPWEQLPPPGSPMILWASASSFTPEEDTGDFSRLVLENNDLESAIMAGHETTATAAPDILGQTRVMNSAGQFPPTVRWHLEGRWFDCIVFVDKFFPRNCTRDEMGYGLGLAYVSAHELGHCLGLLHPTLFGTRPSMDLLSESYSPGHDVERLSDPESVPTAPILMRRDSRALGSLKQDGLAIYQPKASIHRLDLRYLKLLGGQ